jgi:hypothetical protein
MIIDVHCHIWEKQLVEEGLGKLLDSVADELRVPSASSYSLVQNTTAGPRQFTRRAANH